MGGSLLQCYEEHELIANERPEYRDQRVCLFENLLVHNNSLIFVSSTVTRLPPVRLAAWMHAPWRAKVCGRVAISVGWCCCLELPVPLSATGRTARCLRPSTQRRQQQPHPSVPVLLQIRISWEPAVIAPNDDLLQIRVVRPEELPRITGQVGC